MATPEKLAIRREATLLMGVGTKLDPQAVYASTGFSAFEHLPFAAGRVVKAAFIERFNHQPSQDAQDLLWQGIRDVGRIIQGARESHPFVMSEQEILAFSTSEKTVHHVAAIALRRHHLMLDLINSPGSAYRLHPDEDHIELNQTYAPPTQGGCPEAGSGSEVDPSPAFKKFVVWSARLVVPSLIRTYPTDSSLDAMHARQPGTIHHA